MFIARMSQNPVVDTNNDAPLQAKPPHWLDAVLRIFRAIKEMFAKIISSIDLSGALKRLAQKLPPSERSHHAPVAEQPAPEVKPPMREVEPPVPEVKLPVPEDPQANIPQDVPKQPSVKVVQNIDLDVPVAEITTDRRNAQIIKTDNAIADLFAELNRQEELARQQRIKEEAERQAQEIPIEPSEIEVTELQELSEKKTYTDSLGNEYQELARGKDKVVLIKKGIEEGYVYYIPTAKEREDTFLREFALVERIQNAAQKGFEHLALTFERQEGTIEGFPIYRGEKAEGDLGKIILQKDLTWEQRAHLGRGYLAGLAQLHSAGYLGGDHKPDNALVVQGETKIADFGKGEKHRSGYIYQGNTRFMDPVSPVSSAGEMYSAALVLIRTFEEGMLGEDPILTIPNPKDRSEKARGVEKYVVEHGYTFAYSERDDHLTGEVVGRVFRWNKQKAIKAVEDYIDVLEWRLKPELGEKAVALCALLKAMVQYDVKQRPTAEQALEEYNQIFG